MKNRRSGFFGYKENSRTSIYKHTQTRRNGFLLKSKNFFSAMQGLLLCHSKRPCNYTFSAYLQGLLKSGPEGNRTPVRKSIPCSSTIIVCYLSFPLPSENRHPDGFSSFIITPAGSKLCLCRFPHRRCQILYVRVHRGWQSLQLSSVC